MALNRAAPGATHAESGVPCRAVLKPALQAGERSCLRCLFFPPRETKMASQALTGHDRSLNLDLQARLLEPGVLCSRSPFFQACCFCFHGSETGTPRRDASWRLSSDLRLLVELGGIERQPKRNSLMSANSSSQRPQTTAWGSSRRTSHLRQTGVFAACGTMGLQTRRDTDSVSASGGNRIFEEKIAASRRELINIYC